MFLLPLDEIPVHCGVTQPLNSLLPIYTPGWRETLLETRNKFPKNKTRCPWLGLEPGPLDLETSVLTTRPTHLPRPTDVVLMFVSVCLFKKIVKSKMVDTRWQVK